MQIKKEIKAYEERVEKYLIKNNLQIKIHWKCKIYSCLLSNFVDNLAEDINKNKCENSIENCLEYTEEICKTNTKIVDVILNMKELTLNDYNINA